MMMWLSVPLVEVLKPLLYLGSMVVSPGKVGILCTNGLELAYSNCVTKQAAPDEHSAEETQVHMYSREDTTH